MGERPGLYVDGLSVSFKNKVLFEDIHFVLTPGDKVTLVGENGIGKSTFLKILKGDPFEGEGRIQRSGTLGYLPQSFETFPNQRALDHVILQSRDEALIQALQDKVFADSGWEVPFQTLGGHELFRTLAHLALTPDILMKSFGELSGGEKTKLHLCALQHFNPDLLLLDEPTNHLDRKGISWLGRFLRGFEGGLLIVTHDRSLIHESGVRISELSPVTHQLIHFHGGYRGYLEAQERLWERAKQERETQEKEL